MNDPSSSTSTSSDGIGDVAGHRELVELLEGYASLSRDYADADDSRLALLAMWTADLHVLQLLLLESGLNRAADPSAQLAAVGEAVNRSLAAISLDDAMLRLLLERSREAMVATFDESVHAMLLNRFLPLDHLGAMRCPTVDSADRAAEQRLEGRTGDQLVAELETAALDCAAVAGAMVVAGDTDGALRQMYQADLASFEAFLLDAAMGSDDVALASVDLSWDLAARAFAERPAILVDGADLEGTVNAWRERLVVFGGWAQAARMRASFLPLPIA